MSIPTHHVAHTPGPWHIGEPPLVVPAACHIKLYAPSGEIGVLHRELDDDPTDDLSIAEHHANARLIAAAPDLLKAIEELECPDCGHALRYHADKYNCEVERGDGYRIGSEILEALGPCGCDCIDCPDLLPLIAAIRKAKGE